MTTTHTAGIAGLLLMGVLGGAASSQPAPGPSGHWEGSIQVPGQELKIEVDLMPGSSQVWKGTIAIPAQNMKGFPLSAVTVEGDAVGFAMKGIPGDPQFKGTTSKDGHSISGDFSQGGATMPFALAWKGEAHIEAHKSTSVGKEFEGSWEGALDVNGATLRLVLKLANGEDGATGTIVSVDQGGVEIPVTSIAQTAAHLKLAVATIGATYEGDLNEQQIAGTWTQGPGSLPLTFKRPAK
jgi:uncharacterized protein